MSRKSLSIVIPVFENAGSICATYESIKALRLEDDFDVEFEIIFVNDGSSDDSLPEIRSISNSDPKVSFISFTRNFGQLAAITAGYQRSTGDAVVTLSADLQDPVSIIREFIENWYKGAEIVVAYRTDRQDGWLEKLTSKLAYFLLRKSLPSLPRGGFDFLLMTRNAIDLFLATPSKNRYFQGDVLWPGFQTVLIPYSRAKREVGFSQYTFKKRLKLFMDALIDTSNLPIRIAGLSGLIMGGLAFLYSLIIFASWLQGGTPFSGWAPLMIVILASTGMILFTLSILGEYLWRILDELKNKPTYVVSEEG